MNILKEGLKIAALSSLVVSGVEVVNADQAAHKSMDTRGSNTDVLQTNPALVALESRLNRSLDLLPGSQEMGPRVNGLFLTDIRNGNVIGNVDTTTYEKSFYRDSLELMRSVYNQILNSKGYTVEQTDIFMPANLRGENNAVPTLTPNGEGDREISAFFTADGTDANGNPVSEGFVFFPSGSTGGWDVYTSHTADLENALGGFNGRTIIEVPSPRDRTLLAFQYQTSDVPSVLVGVGTPNTDPDTERKIVWRAELTPDMVAATLNLPEGIYNLDSNVAFGPNLMLKDTDGNIIAVSSSDGELWQTPVTLASSLGLDTNAEDGSTLNYSFKAGQGNILLWEQRTETQQRGVQAMLDEKDGTWVNLRGVFEQMILSPLDYHGTFENTQGEHMLVFHAVSLGVREDLELPIPQTDGVGNIFLKAAWLSNPNPRGPTDPRLYTLNVGLVALQVQFQGTELYMDWFAKGKDVLTAGVPIVGRFPLGMREFTHWFPSLTENPGSRHNLTSVFYLQVFENKTGILQQLGHNEPINEPIVMDLGFSVLEEHPAVKIQVP